MSDIYTSGLSARPVFREFPDAQSLAENLSERLAAALKDALDRDGVTSLAVSGGSTPKPLFDRLCAVPLPWRRITVTLADERWVDTDSPESNEFLVSTRLLTGRAAGAGFVGLKTRHATPEEGAREAEERLRAVPRPFGAVVLGMGRDGHTASLFPHADGLEAALDPASRRLVMPVKPGGAGAAALPRLTLTLHALMESRLIVLHITGAEKRSVYERALAGEDMLSMPVRAVLRQTRAPVEVWWAP